MPSNTSFNPKNVLEFEKSKLSKNAIGIFQIVDLGTTTDIDYVLQDDCLLAGGSLFLVKNVKWGDKVTLQVLDGEVVLSTFITDWYLNPDEISQKAPPSNYAAKIPAGLTIRVKYTSTGDPQTDNAPEVAINYNFEKVLE